jgi:hypothetical protein
LASRTARRNSRVPERAIVPMFWASSSRVIPMSLSDTDRVRASGSTSSVTASSPTGVSSGRLSASKRTLSSASEALEISSRRKMSLCE